MGSYGDAWLQCTYCGKWGKCLEHPLPIGTPSLLDVDGSGVLCDPCYDRGYPPHYDWLEIMFATKLGGLPLTTIAITEYAYQRCADYKEQHIRNQILFASMHPLPDVLTISDATEESDGTGSNTMDEGDQEEYELWLANGETENSTAVN